MIVLACQSAGSSWAAAVVVIAIVFVVGAVVITALLKAKP